MERLNWFGAFTVILLLMILGVLWVIKEVLEDKKETDTTLIRNSRRFRQFITKDYFFRKSQQKINQEIIKELQTTYSEYEAIEELRDELLGIKVNIKEENDDFGFIFTAIFSLLLSLIHVFSNMPSAILIISSILIMGAIALYLNKLFYKVKMEHDGSSIIIYMLPAIIAITTIMIFGILLGSYSSTVDLSMIDWLFKVIVIEAAFLYTILLYEKVKYVSYLEVVSIVLNEMILEEDRKLWMK